MHHQIVLLVATLSPITAVCAPMEGASPIYEPPTPTPLDLPNPNAPPSAPAPTPAPTGLTPDEKANALLSYISERSALGPDPRPHTSGATSINPRDKRDYAWHVNRQFWDNKIRQIYDFPVETGAPILESVRDDQRAFEETIQEETTRIKAARAAHEKAAADWAAQVKANEPYKKAILEGWARDSKERARKAEAKKQKEADEAAAREQAKLKLALARYPPGSQGWAKAMAGGKDLDEAMIWVNGTPEQVREYVAKQEALWEENYEIREWS